MSSSVRVAFRAEPNAVRTVAHAGERQLDVVARQLVTAIPERVPVHHGVMRRQYRPSVTPADDAGMPTRRVFVGSPFWHWLEYGTANNPAYRVVQNAVVGVGLRYEPL